MKKITFTSLLSLSLISLVYACSNPASLDNKMGVVSKIENVPKIKGVVQFGEKITVRSDSAYKLKASIADVAAGATVAMLNTPDHPTSPNKTLVTGVTDSNGSFILQNNFIPNVDDIFVLEASKRIGGSGKGVITLRTYVKWTGTDWASMTDPGIYINSKTTALAIIAGYNTSTISANDTIGKIDTSGDTSVVSQVGSITVLVINDVAEKVSWLLSQEKDPSSEIKFLNSNYVVNNKEILGKFSKDRNCEECDFSKSILSYVDLSYSNLKKSNFSGTDLTTSNLSGANLTGSNFSNSNLSGLDLSDTILDEVIFTNANLSNVKLNDKILVSSNFSGINFSSSNLSNSDFSNSNMTNTIFNEEVPILPPIPSLPPFFINPPINLAGSNLNGVNFTNSNMKYVDFQQVASLIGSIFTNTNLTGANFIGTNLAFCDFTNANLTGAYILDSLIKILLIQCVLFNLYQPHHQLQE